MDRAAREWARTRSGTLVGLRRLGYFGSYARGDWGVGSDLDLIAIVTASAEPLARRALAVDLLDLPVPAELLVFTESEWAGRLAAGGGFAPRVEREAVWLIG